VQRGLGATAQQRPIVLVVGEVPAEIQSGDLAQLAANTLAEERARKPDIYHLVAQFMKAYCL